VGRRTPRRRRPPASGVASSYDGGVGDVRLDLSRVDVSDLDRPIRTTLHTGVGDVDVLLPEDADARVVVNHGLGDVTVLPDEAPDGDLYPGEGPGSWVDDGTAEIILTINAGVGDLEVSRA
jgi:hypothetical protein